MTTTKRRSSSSKISKSSVEQANLTLEQLPEKQKDAWSLREAIASMQDAITAALAKGYSYEEVAEMLTDRGVDVSPSSLKYYLSRLSRTQTPSASPKRRKPRKTRKTDAEQLDVDFDADQEDEAAEDGTPALDATQDTIPSVEDAQPALTTDSTDETDSVDEEDSADAAPSGRATRKRTSARKQGEAETQTRSKSATKTRTASKAPATRGRRKKETV